MDTNQLEEEARYHHRIPHVVSNGKKLLLRHSPNGLNANDVPVRFFRHESRKSAILWDVATGKKQHGLQRRWSTFTRLYENNMIDCVELQDGYLVYLS